jgi:hypothetical protein
MIFIVFSVNVFQAIFEKLDIDPMPLNSNAIRSIVETFK